jgi:2-dehydropantoate 2-reductase
VIGLKTTANHVLPDLLPPLIGARTAVLTLQNGLGNEEELEAFVDASQILGGLCFVCLNRVEPGVIRHTAHGSIVLGEYRGAENARTRSIADRFRHAGVPCELTVNLSQAHWEKLMWNIPFNGLGVAGSAGYKAVLTGCPPVEAVPRVSLATDRLLGDARWERLVRELMEEVLAVGRACGCPIEQTLVEEMIARTRCMGAYRASTLIDFELGRALELDSLFLEPLRRAQAARVATPRLVSLCAILSALETRREKDPG